MFLLIGSMAIQMIAVRNSFRRYMRSAEIKIAQLREVVERIQNGESVDVEAALGTGNAQKEADWEEGTSLPIQVGASRSERHSRLTWLCFKFYGRSSEETRRRRLPNPRNPSSQLRPRKNPLPHKRRSRRNSRGSRLLRARRAPLVNPVPALAISSK
jgi:hypothetical protein